MGSTPQYTVSTVSAATADISITPIMREEARRFTSVQSDIFPLNLPTVYVTMLARNQMLTVEGSTITAMIRKSFSESPTVSETRAEIIVKSAADADDISIIAPAEAVFFTL